MPIRNIQILVIAAIVSLGCYLQAKKYKYAERIGAAIQVIEQNYVEPVDAKDLYLSAMTGMVENLDPYSEFIAPTEYKQFQSAIEQQFGGVGILIEGPPASERLTVIAPLVGTPAYEAGLQPGDVITHIDEQSTEKMKADEAMRVMRGEVGSLVKLKVARTGLGEQLNFELRRADIQVDSVFGDRIEPDSKWNYFLPEDNRIAYIRVTIFGERTVEEFRRALHAIKYDAKALIIDVRFNPGGILNAAVEMCDMLLDKGRIVSTKGRRSHYDAVADADSQIELPTSIPIIVLVNNQSASASEILAACLQDLGRASVCGERTFGKGTVQQVFEIENDQTAVKFTTARYYRPSGANIHRTDKLTEKDAWGVIPEKSLELKLTEWQQVNVYRRWQYRGDPRKIAAPEQPPSPTCSGDPQLRLALARLRAIADLSTRLPPGRPPETN